MRTARKLRVLVAKLGLDDHDFGARLVALAFCDAGFEVIYAGCRQTPEQIVSCAVQEDVDLIGLSSLSSVHGYSIFRVLELLRESEAEDIPIVGGGISPRDIPRFKEMGMKEIFEPGVKPDEIARWVGNNIRPRKGIVPANWNGGRRAPATGHDLGWGNEYISRIRQPAACNGHSPVNTLGSGKTLAEMALYFEPPQIEHGA